MIQATCPHCRHVVGAEAPGSARCPNCGMEVTVRAAGDGVRPPLADAAPPKAPPRPVPAGPSATPGMDTVAGVHPVTSPPARGAADRPVRTATLLTLIFGLLVIVPFLTQVAALVCGAIALGRRRIDNERVAAAWIGVLLALAAFIGWGVACRWTLSVRNQPGGIFAFPYVGAPGGEDADELPGIGEMQDAMTSIEAACRDYRADFRRWPSGVDPLRSGYLPSDFKLVPGVTLHLPPADAVVEGGRWILASSDPVLTDLEGRPRTRPHKLIIRPGGKVELLPADEVDAELARQQGESAAARP